MDQHRICIGPHQAGDLGQVPLPDHYCYEWINMGSVSAPTRPESGDKSPFPTTIAMNGSTWDLYPPPPGPESGDKSLFRTTIAASSCHLGGMTRPMGQSADQLFSSLELV